MIPYKNLWSKKSWVVAYEIWDDYIKVQFTSWFIYTYTYQSAWSSAIETMKQLAECWEGLNSYISKNKPAHSSKV